MTMRPFLLIGFAVGVVSASAAQAQMLHRVGCAEAEVPNYYSSAVMEPRSICVFAQQTSTTEVWLNFDGYRTQNLRVGLTLNEAKRLNSALGKGIEWAEVAKDQQIETDRKNIPNGSIAQNSRSQSGQKYNKVEASFSSRRGGSNSYVLLSFDKRALLWPGQEGGLPTFYLSPGHAGALIDAIEKVERNVEQWKQDEIARKEKENLLK